MVVSMSDSTSNIAKTTARAPGTDPLSEPLRSLRVRGGLLLRESYPLPWGVEIPCSEQLAPLLGVDGGALVAAFHYVEAGEVDIHHSRGTTRLTAGEMAVVFGGEAHSLRGGQAGQLVQLQDLLESGRRVFPWAAVSVPSASLMCGVFVLQDLRLNPLIAALPSVLSCAVSTEGGGVASWMAREIDSGASASGFVVERLLEVLCAVAIRAYVSTTTDRSPSMLTAQRDSVVARALTLLHARPGEPWSVGRLADQVGMSPSRLSARFSQGVGQSVMAYLTGWRMHLACRQLREEEGGLDEIAAGLGYSNTPSFHRAFKRTVGVSPGTWRKRDVSVR